MWAARSQHYPPYARIRDATALGAGEPDDGPVIATGTATRDTGTVRSMLGDEALCAVSEVYGYSVLPRPPGWFYQAYRIRSARFAVQTADGRCIVPPIREKRSSFGRLPFVGFSSRVERGLPTTASGNPKRPYIPEKWQFDVDTPHYCLTLPYTERDNPPVEAVAMEVKFDLSAPSAPTPVPYLRRYGTRRYQESTIEEGDEVTVVGTLTDPTAENPVLGAPEDGRLLVLTLSPEDLERRYRRIYHWYLYKLPVLIILVPIAIYLVLVMLLAT